MVCKRIGRNWQKLRIIQGCLEEKHITDLSTPFAYFNKLKNGRGTPKDFNKMAEHYDKPFAPVFQKAIIM